MLKTQGISSLPIVLNIFFCSVSVSNDIFFPEWKYLHCQYKQNGSSLYKKSKNTEVP